MALFEIKIEIPPSAVGPADDLLLEHGRENWSVLEDVIGRRAWLVGIGPDESSARRDWSQLEPVLAAGAVQPLAAPEIRGLGDADWRDSYKAHFHAWRFGRLHWVPAWERATFSLPPGDAVLWLDPGLAFGTGNHETTRLCVERLVAFATQLGVGVENPVAQDPGRKTPDRAPPRVVDAGCGSGILALSAALLGFGEVIGFDNDPEAVRVSEENAALNGLAGRVRFFVGDLVSGLADEKEGADVVLANIQADVLMRFARELVGAVRPGGTLIMSGILASENSPVRTSFEALTPNWAINARTMGEWSDVVLSRPK